MVHLIHKSTKPDTILHFGLRILSCACAFSQRISPTKCESFVLWSHPDVFAPILMPWNDHVEQPQQQITLQFYIKQEFYIFQL
jgi:hypothetical protein